MAHARPGPSVFDDRPEDDDDENDDNSDMSSEDESDSDRSRDRRGKQQPCKYYNQGSCKNGQSCDYIHVCQYYIRGKCRYGNKCKLSHDGAAEPESPDSDSECTEDSEPLATYQWQVRKGTSWLNVKHDWVIEAQYSQPGATGIKIFNTKFGAISIDFKRMKVRGKDLGVRRRPGKDDCWVWYCSCHDQWKAYGEKDSNGKYSNINSAEVEKQYQRHRRGSFQFTVESKPYQINFSEMRQVNATSHTHRKVRRRPKFVGPKAEADRLQIGNLAIAGQPRWQFQGDSGQWHDFKQQDASSVTSDQIEAQYQQNPKGTITYSNGKFKYSLDFSAMCQTNLATKTTRKVQRL